MSSPHLISPHLIYQKTNHPIPASAQPILSPPSLPLPPCVSCLFHRCEGGGEPSKFTFQCLYSSQIHLTNYQVRLRTSSRDQQFAEICCCSVVISGGQRQRECSDRCKMIPVGWRPVTTSANIWTSSIQSIRIARNPRPHILTLLPSILCYSLFSVLAATF